MISVLLCTLNGGRWLPQQLQSLLEQDLKPSELVVCDDGSTDTTIDLLEDFRHQSPFPVRVHCNNNKLGYALNFLRAIALAENPFVAFCDQDDIWLPDKLSLSFSVLKETSSLLVAHGFDLIDGNGRKLGSTYDSTGPLPPTGYRLGPVGCAGFSLLLDKKLLDYAPSALSPESYLTFCQGVARNAVVGHDALLCELASCLNAGAFIAKPLVLHRLHGDNASKENLRQGVDCKSRLITKALARWKQRACGYKIYKDLAFRLGKEVEMYSLMAKELEASRHSVEYLNNQIRLLKVRENDNALRANLYAQKSSGLPGFLRMLFQGCYQSDGVRLGYLNAIKDFLVVTTSALGVR